MCRRKQGAGHSFISHFINHSFFHIDGSCYWDFNNIGIHIIIVKVWLGEAGHGQARKARQGKE